jgi:hypothetical protein
MGMMEWCLIGFLPLMGILATLLSQEDHRERDLRWRTQDPHRWRG